MMNTCMRILFLLVILLSAPSYASGQGDDFGAKLEALRRSPLERGGDAHRDAYKRFIAEYAGDPRVAEAMLDLERLTKDDEFMFMGDGEALVWLRKAAATATPGSKLWFEIQFRLARRVRWLEPDGPAETRRILDLILANAGGDSLVLAKVEEELMSLCLFPSEDAKRDYDAAERHSRRLLHWYDNPARVPKDGWDKMELDGLIRSGGGFVGSFVGAPWPKAEREKRIKKFMADHAHIQFVQRHGERALEQVAQDPEYVDLAAFRTSRSKADYKVLMVILGVGALVIISLFLLRRWKLGHFAPH